MKFFFISLNLFWTVLLGAQSRNIFYKTIDSEKSSDSIQTLLISEKIEFIKFSKPCYWETRDSVDISYYNSHLFIYKDLDSLYKSVLVTEFFIFKEQYKENKPFQYSSWNKEELLSTKIRPDTRDLRIWSYPDTILALEMGIDLTKVLSSTDSTLLETFSGSGYEHYNKGRDGLPGQYISIFSSDSIRDIYIDQYLFFPSNYYYRYNSKLPIYTLRILLEQEFQSLEESIAYYLENEEHERLHSLGKLDFESNKRHYEKVYEEAINRWIEEANYELDKKWRLKK